MKKVLLSLLTVSATLCTVAQSSQIGWSQSAFKQNPASSIVGKSAISSASIAPVTIVEEDFSLFTAGSEENPDSENIAPGTNYIYMINDGYMHVTGWGGYYVFQAGGACALKQYTDTYYGMTRYGHIQTPESELYGEATVTFRARRAHSNPGAGDLDLALCDNYSGRLETTTITLTDSWEEYSWTSNKGSFNSHNIFQFTPVNGEILLDDIKVTRIRNKIPSTSVLSPMNVSATEFIAQWSPSELPAIDGYIFNAYYKDMPAEYVEPGTIAYDFESIKLKDDGKSINTENPGFPENWTIDVSSNGTKDMCTESGSFNSGKQSINLDAVGDIILSPETPAPINKISFWVKPSTMDYEGSNISLLGVHVKNTSDEWEHIANIPNYWLTQNGGYYTFEGDQVGHYINQVKITCESSYSVTFAIDDIQLDYETQPIPYPLIVDAFTTDTCYTVANIDPSKEHFYYVQVKEGDLLSSPTYDMWVDGINGVTPNALPASNVTETGFTANWDPLYNASHYKLAINQIYDTSVDNEEVELAYEDFSALTEGTVTSPYNPWTMAHNLADNGQSEQDWSLTNPQWAAGMAGSTGTSWSGAAGLVLSPKMKLGNNTIKVDVTAYNTAAGDKLWVMVIEEYNSSTAIVAKTLDFSETETGFITGSVLFEDFDFGDKPLHIAFMSQNGVGFFIDEAKISAIIPAKGTAVERPFKVALPESNSYTLSDLPTGILKYNYNVIAKRTKDFVDYVSEKSATIDVELLAASVEDIAINQSKVYSDGGILYISVQNETDYEIYNVSGVLAESGQISGDASISLPSGIYIVKVNSEVHKVIVK